MARAGEGLGLFDGTVREATVFDAFVVTAGVGAVPGAGLTLVGWAAEVAGARAVAVLSTLDTPANGGVAVGGWRGAVTVCVAGTTSTAES